MPSTISDLLCVYGGTKARTIVFCETKKECNELVVNPAIKMECLALHGDIPQNTRETTLAAFREGRIKASAQWITGSYQLQGWLKSAGCTGAGGY
jgi:ATP-dependent RNA helicase DDX21